MMFNGLLCGDSDASDITKESGVSSADASAVSGACDAARAHYYHSKLLATLQVLQNKEETLRVQAESLALAESRIQSLAAKVDQLKAELEEKTQELQVLSSMRRMPSECKKCNKGSEIQAESEVKKQKTMVATLQNNLSVIEELYRECFYESAKQEELIELLRSSCQEVRAMERERCDQVGRLQNQLNAHKCSLDQCQDIALEVDHLKSEISNFLSSSNNDSGVWERDDSPPISVGEDLRDIMDQLVLLKQLLQRDCFCGLQKETMRLKQLNETLQKRVMMQEGCMCKLQEALQSQETTIDDLTTQHRDTQDQLMISKQELQSLEDINKQRNDETVRLQEELKKTQATLKEKCVELSSVQQRCDEHLSSIVELQVELEKANKFVQESNAVRAEVSLLTSQVSVWRAQLAASDRRARAVEAELASATDHCRQLDICYRDKVSAANALQSQLECAYERGAELCGEARRVVGAVRNWMRGLKEKIRTQEETIKQKECYISSLRQQLSCHSLPRAGAGAGGALGGAGHVGCSKCAGKRKLQMVNTPSATKMTSCSKCAKNSGAKETRPDSSSVEEELASCSRYTVGVVESGGGRGPARSESAPIPPRRVLRKKKLLGGDKQRCRARPSSHDVCAQSPGRAPAHTLPVDAHTQRTISPSQELMERMDNLQEGLADGLRRWTRGRLDNTR